MSADFIHVKGARVHNLKNVEVKIPRNKLVVFTGPSGSGKSSLAFETIYAEGQRRYLESLSSYARQFLQSFDKPDVDHITGLSPAIAIEQKAASHNPRSTVGTVTEIYDYLRVLYARCGQQYCYNCGRKVGRQSIDEMVEQVQAMGEGKRIYILAPVVSGRKGEYKDVFAGARLAGFARVRVNGEIINLTEDIKLDKKRKHEIEIVVDRLMLGEEAQARLTEGVELALKESDDGTMRILDADNGEEFLFSERNACVHCGISYEELSPQNFSFNSPKGACPACDGLGTSLEVDADLLMPDRSLSLAEGAVKYWGILTGHRDELAEYVEGYLNQWNVGVNTPVEEFPPAAIKGILDGGNFTWRGRKRRFEGVSESVRRLYQQTQSEGMRRWYSQFFSDKPCESCQGQRLAPSSLAVKVGERSIAEVVELDIIGSLNWAAGLPQQLNPVELEIAAELLKEISERLGFLVNVGLTYLTMSRSAPTLSGGESQRIRLASQIGSGLTGVLYVLDEPSIGLHQRDNQKLIATLESLRDLGNTVLVVEHDEETMLRADCIVDFGPHAGVHGGTIVDQGTALELMKRGKTITGRYLSGKDKIEVPAIRRPGRDEWIEIRGAQANNLQEVNVRLPLGCFVCVTGVSGSGKSSLVNETLWKASSNLINRSLRRSGKFQQITGIAEYVDKVIQINQKPIGRTPRSNPVTYTGVWDEIRALFAELPESRIRGFKPGRFSFNVKGGRCESCQGDGVKRIEMHFLSDVFVQCDVCQGRRFNRETLAVNYKGKNIFDVLNLTVGEALEHFENMPKITNSLTTLAEVGLDYIALGQSAPTLSGGESQRVKLAKELSKRSTGRTLYLLDEPTTGLHFEDIRKLLVVLQRLVEGGNTVVVIEHNLDVIKTADWIVDLGPEGGSGGGKVVAEGTPEQVAAVKESYTGQFLKPMLEAGKGERRVIAAPAKAAATAKPTAASRQSAAAKSSAASKQAAADKHYTPEEQSASVSHSTEAKSDPKAEAKSAAKPAGKSETKPFAKSESNSSKKSAAKPSSK